MAAEIAVNTGTLQKDIDEMTTKLEALISAMQKSIEGIESLSGMWEGAAKMVFMNQFVSDCKILDQQCKTIQSIIECMEYAKKEYDICEAEVQGIVNAINV